MAESRILVYLLRRDLRTSDNPILHYLSSNPDHGFTHLLPIYVFPAHQIEVSGFLQDGEKSPYPEARSPIGKFWRCGPHRAKFLAQTVWDLKDNLERLSSGLMLRVGKTSEVLRCLVEGLDSSKHKVGAVLMFEELAFEEVAEQDEISAVCSEHGVDFRLWTDEKYFVDDRDIGWDKPSMLPDVFTEYRKSQEPLRERPRRSVPPPRPFSLPPMLHQSDIPAQGTPFVVPDSYKDLELRLLKPLQNIISNPQPFPKGAESAHPFRGGETSGQARLRQLIKNGIMSTYHDTRNGLYGPDYSTKLSAYLSHGSITARQIHEELSRFEQGSDRAYESAPGFGKGESPGTNSVRRELVWRDYMRLCTRKFGRRLFFQSGFKHDVRYKEKWVTADKTRAKPDQEPSPDKVAVKLQRFLEGITGMGLIDASQRELYHTGYTSNRARQNVASFLSKHLEIDWRYGAEWYESMLVDYDVSSNWSNWQYVAGVGNDPRGDARTLNPVKQAFDYDKEGNYVRMWVPELAKLQDLQNLFQPCTTSQKNRRRLGLVENIMVTDPLKRIDFLVVEGLYDPDKRFRFPRYLNGPRNGRVYGLRGFGKGHIKRGKRKDQDNEDMGNDTEPEPWWSYNADSGTGIARNYHVPQARHPYARPQSVPLITAWEMPHVRPQSAFQASPWDSPGEEDHQESVLVGVAEMSEEESHDEPQASQQPPQFAPKALSEVKQPAIQSLVLNSQALPFHPRPQVPPNHTPVIASSQINGAAGARPLASPPSQQNGGPGTIGSNRRNNRGNRSGNNNPKNGTIGPPIARSGNKSNGPPVSRSGNKHSGPLIASGVIKPIGPPVAGSGSKFGGPIIANSTNWPNGPDAAGRGLVGLPGWGPSSGPAPGTHHMSNAMPPPPPQPPQHMMPPLPSMKHMHPQPPPHMGNPFAFPPHLQMGPPFPPPGLTPDGHHFYHHPPPFSLAPAYPVVTAPFQHHGAPMPMDYHMMPQPMPPHMISQPPGPHLAMPPQAWSHMSAPHIMAHQQM